MILSFVRTRSLRNTEWTRRKGSCSQGFGQMQGAATSPCVITPPASPLSSRDSRESGFTGSHGRQGSLPEEIFRRCSLVGSNANAESERKLEMVAPVNRSSRESGRNWSCKGISTGEGLGVSYVNSRVQHEVVPPNREPAEEFWLIGSRVGIHAKAGTRTKGPYEFVLFCPAPLGGSIVSQAVVSRAA